MFDHLCLCRLGIAGRDRYRRPPICPWPRRIRRVTIFRVLLETLEHHFDQWFLFDSYAYLFQVGLSITLSGRHN